MVLSFLMKLDLVWNSLIWMMLDGFVNLKFLGSSLCLRFSGLKCFVCI